jgi:hypothetical protein
MTAHWPCRVWREGAFLDPVDRGVARAAEDGELGDVLVPDHGVVAPLAGGDHPPIDAQDQVQLTPLEEDGTGHGPGRGLPVGTGRVRIEAHPEHLGRDAINASAERPVFPTVR